MVTQSRAVAVGDGVGRPDLTAPGMVPAMTDEAPTVDPMAPVLDDEQLARLANFGRRRPVETGDILYRNGDATYDFYVVLSGEVIVIPVAECGASSPPIPSCRT